jgi:tRNA pseudouridine13 synthase
MRIKHRIKDFRVEELIELPINRGSQAYYRVEKWGIPTTMVRNILASKLGLSPSAVTFPALKDARAVAVQYASARVRNAPKHIHHKRFRAQLMGRGSRTLSPSYLQGNRFTIVVRDLSEQQVEALSAMSHSSDLDDSLEAHGLPNYYDEQRFGSLSEKGFIGKAILMRDAELAVRIYLSEPMLRDPKKVVKFKELAQAHWGQWGFLLHKAPRPSNFRSVITYLKDHPHNYRKAVNLIQDRLLSIYLSAYQSWVWNQIVGRYFEQTLDVDAWLTIAGEQFPLPGADADVAALEDVIVQGPRLTAYYEGPLAEAAEAALAEEGLTLQDFKARILKRAYLSKTKRSIWFRPLDVHVGTPEVDDAFSAGRGTSARWATSMTFTLTPGCYATLVLKVLALRLGTELRTR